MSDNSRSATADVLTAPGSAPPVQPAPPPPQRSAPPPPVPMLRGIIVRALIVGLAVLAGGLFMVNWDDLLLLSPVQRTDDAYLRGDPTRLSARVPGYVRRVAVAELDTVKARQVLYEIDDAEYSAQVDLARAQVADGSAQVAIATAQIALQERQIDVTQGNVDFAESDLIQAVQEAGWQNGLRGTPAYLQRALEQATQNALALEATVAGNRAQIASQTAQLKVLRACSNRRRRLCSQSRPHWTTRRSNSATRA